MSERRGWKVVAIALAMGVAGESAAGFGEATVVSFENLGTFQASQFTVQGVRVTATEDYGFPGVVNVYQLNGLGVVGADSDLSLDTSEGLRFQFDGFVASDVWYQPGTVYGGDNDEYYAEMIVTGYGPGGAKIASVQTYGTRLTYINALFGGSPLSGFTLEPFDGDRLVISAISYVRASPATCISFENLGTFQASQFTVQGVRVTATEDYGFPGVVNVLQLNGLGVVGGVSDLSLDTSEGLRFQFDGFVASDVWYQPGTVYGGDNDEYYAEMVVTGYGPGGAKIASVQTYGTRLIYINALFGGSPLSGFTLEPFDGDRLLISSICLIAPSQGCAGDINEDGDTDVFDFGIFVRDFGCKGE